MEVVQGAGNIWDYQSQTVLRWAAGLSPSPELPTRHPKLTLDKAIKHEQENLTKQLQKSPRWLQNKTNTSPTNPIKEEQAKVHQNAKSPKINIRQHTDRLSEIQQRNR